jgi:hypothetical protein
LSDALLQLIYGWLAVLIVVLLVISILALTVLARRSGWRPRVLRRIDAYDSLPTTVGQAVETGRRLHVSLGTGLVGTADTAATVAGLTMLDQISAAAAVSDRPPVVTTSDGAAMLLAQDTLRSVYSRQNALARYDPESAEVAGLTPLSYGAAQTSLPSDQAVAGAVLIGTIGQEAVLLAEAGSRNGVTTLAGTDNLTTQAMLFASADHPVIGEDVFAGAAYIGGQPAHVASLTAQDMLRVAIVIVVIVGVVVQSVHALGLF